MADPFLTVTFDDKITPALKSLPRRIQRVVAKVTTKTADTVFKRIVRDTPRDTGSAAGGWTKKSTGSGAAKVVTFRNDVPYINVLEFGGYPVRPGPTFGGFPPGPRTAKAPGGDPKTVSNVSLQAPKGMARKNLAAVRPEYLFDLEEALQRAFDSGGGA